MENELMERLLFLIGGTVLGFLFGVYTAYSNQDLLLKNQDMTLIDRPVYTCPYTPKGCTLKKTWKVFETNYKAEQREALRKIMP